MPSAPLEWTSVPRWTAPELPAAASYLVCWFGDGDGDGDGARLAVQALLARADPGVPVRMAGFARTWDAPVETGVRQLIGECRVGVRIILAGPESTVMRSAAVARELGASAEELILVAIETVHQGYVTGVAGRRVFCASCRCSFDAVAAIGGTTACPECAAALIVDCRFSRPHAAYFGWPAGLDQHR